MPPRYVNNFYNPGLKHRARHMRKRPTRGEFILWHAVLRRRHMRGYQFLRQRPILGYVADFMCKELKLVIEVDGATHNWESRKRQDGLRDDVLAQRGYTVLRFRDDDIIYETDRVKTQIETWIINFEKADGPPQREAPF